MAELGSAKHELDVANKVPESELCEFVNTDTGKRCRSRATYRCSSLGIVSNVRTCARHAKPFMGKTGMQFQKIVHV